MNKRRPPVSHNILISASIQSRSVWLNAGGEIALVVSQRSVISLKACRHKCHRVQLRWVGHRAPLCVSEAERLQGCCIQQYRAPHLAKFSQRELLSVAWSLSDITQQETCGVLAFGKRIATHDTPYAEALYSYCTSQIHELNKVNKVTNCCRCFRWLLEIWKSCINKTTYFYPIFLEFQMICRRPQTMPSRVAWRCVLEQKLLLTVYTKSYMRNRLVPKWMTLTFLDVVSRSSQPLRYI